MSREEIDAAIQRHAETELLYDKPYEGGARLIHTVRGVGFVLREGEP